jgi:RimJ/RimL family protein N-acetyltransferase
MIIRTITESELDDVLSLIVPDPACPRMTAELCRRRFDTGEYRPGFTWLALPDKGAAPLALAFWWAGPDEPLPAVLDGLYCRPSVADRVTLAAELLKTAHAAFADAGAPEPPEYHLFLPAGWRENPEVAAPLAWRREAARRAGLPAALDRLRFRWTLADGLPESSTRLRFDVEPDDEVFLELFRRVVEGTLDATSRGTATRSGVEAYAREEFAHLRDLLCGDRAWWRVARRHDGTLVGFGVPSHNTELPVVGYLGVLPEERGHGYGADILADTTRFLAIETGAEIIHADTDLANEPMAAAFRRVGYRDNGCRLVLSAAGKG